MGRGLFIMGNEWTFLNLVFVDINGSKLVHTSSIYAEYTPLCVLLKNIKFLPKISIKQSDVSNIFIYNGAPL